MAGSNDRHVADRNDCHAPKPNGSQVYNSDNKLGDRGIVEGGLGSINRTPPFDRRAEWFNCITFVHV